MKPGAFFALLLVILPATVGAEEARHVRKKISLDGVTTVRLEVPTVYLKLLPAPGSEVRLDLELECVGELIACGQVVREMRFAVSGTAETVLLRVEGPAGFEEHLRSDQRRQKPGGRGRHSEQLGGRYDGSGKTRGSIWDWSWNRPDSGDWAAAATLEIRYPMKAALDLVADDADVELQDLQVPARVEMNRGSFFAGIQEAFAATVALEVRRGEAQIFDRTAREIGTSTARNRIEWQGPGDKTSLEVKMRNGSAQVRLQ
jgi:hypothetical protein